MIEIKDFSELEGKVGNTLILSSYPPVDMEGILRCLRMHAKQCKVKNYEIFFFPREKVMGWYSV